MSVITEMEVDAWKYVHGWADRTTSDRTRHCPEEDALVVASRFLGVDRNPRLDGFVGRVSFTALGDIIDVELYDPHRILYGVVPHHPSGMPMQGLLSTQRIFEDQSSQTHVGVDGELYRPSRESHVVELTPIDRISKLAILGYFESRIDAVVGSLNL